MSRRQTASPKCPAELRVFELLDGLGDDQLQLIFGALKMRQLTSSPDASHAASELRDLLLIWSGAYRLMLARDGDRAHFIRSLGPGDHIGEVSTFLDTDAPSYLLETEQPGLVLVLEGDALRAFARSMPALRNSILNAVAQTALGNADRVFELTAFSERERLCAFLLRLARSEPLRSRADIAKPVLATLSAHINAEQANVAQLLSELEGERLILVSDSYIRLLEPQRLESEVERAFSRHDARWRT